MYDERKFKKIEVIRSHIKYGEQEEILLFHTETNPIHHPPYENHK